MNIMKKILGIFVVGSLFFFGGVSLALGACTLSTGFGFVCDAPVSGAHCTLDASTGGYICDSDGSAATAAAGGPSTAAVRGGGTPFSVDVPQIANPIKYDTFSDFVAAVLQVAAEILMPFVVLAFIWSGFLFVKAQGKPEELETAKKAIYWSIIGAFILMGAWGFAQIIGTTVSTLTQ